MKGAWTGEKGWVEIVVDLLLFGFRPTLVASIFIGIVVQWDYLIPSLNCCDFEHQKLHCRYIRSYVPYLLLINNYSYFYIIVSRVAFYVFTCIVKNFA